MQDAVKFHRSIHLLGVLEATHLGPALLQPPKESPIFLLGYPVFCGF